VQIVGRGLAGPTIDDNLERDLLSYVEVMHSCTFDGPDVHENILAASLRLNETEASLGVEPLHGSLRHETHLSDEGSGQLRRSRSRSCLEIWQKFVSPTHSARRGQFVRPKLDLLQVVRNLPPHKGHGDRVEKKSRFASGASIFVDASGNASSNLPMARSIFPSRSVMCPSRGVSEKYQMAQVDTPMIWCGARRRAPGSDVSWRSTRGNDRQA
jgi:hypothetical protein